MDGDMQREKNDAGSSETVRSASGSIMTRKYLYSDSEGEHPQGYPPDNFQLLVLGTRRLLISLLRCSQF